MSFGSQSIRFEPTPGAGTFQKVPGAQPIGPFLGFVEGASSRHSRIGDGLRVFKRCRECGNSEQLPWQRTKQWRACLGHRTIRVFLVSLALASGPAQRDQPYSLPTAAMLEQRAAPGSPRGSGDRSTPCQSASSAASVSARPVPGRLGPCTGDSG